MATGREIKNRIKSVQNTKKITRTMELVSTAKAKRATDRVNGAKPYADKTQELIESIARSGSASDSPLMRTHSAGNRRAAVFLIAANRGLCGGYNNNVVKLARTRAQELQDEGYEVATFVSGKKPATVLRFLGVELEETYDHIDDKVSFDEAAEFADRFMKAFTDGEYDKVEVVFTKYLSAGKQVAHLEPVLPISFEESEEEQGSQVVNMIFEPSPEIILNALLPRSVRIKFYQAFLDAAASEQIARRIAMKNATEAASDMIKSLKLTYNRARQAKITQEIAEIVAGAASSE